MAKGLFGSAKSFFKNLLVHAGRVLSGKESRAQALKSLREDSQKLRIVALGEKPDEAHHRHAVKLVKQGRASYNAQQYDKAEKLFRHAATEDATYTLALLYLGNALYKLNRSEDAVSAWRRAHAAAPESKDGLEALKRMQHVARQKVDLLSRLEDETRLS